MTALLVSGLLHARVEDVDGRRVGRVHDIVAHVSAPPGGQPGRHRMRVEALIVAPAGVLERLGLSRSHPPRPRLVAWLLRGERVVEWSDVASFDNCLIRLSVSRGALAARTE